MIDLHILPKKAQNELIDFYKFLVERYVTEKNKNQKGTLTSKKQGSNFFDGYNIDLSDFKFNRSEIYDR
jgi:hypothetical protein